MLSRLIQTNFYRNSSSFVNGKITYHMFSEIDNEKHARLKRPVVHHYSASKVRVMEPLVDKVLLEFCDHLQKRFVNPEKACDFGNWLAYFAWDFLGAVTFSKKFGYMEEGYDFDGTLAIADKAIDYLGVCGQMPWLDYCLDKNPVYPLGPPNIANVTRIAIERLTIRSKGEDTEFRPDRPDFLQYFMESKESHPKFVNDTTIVGYTLLNLLAGADTTTITMKALFYYCLKNKPAWEKLQAEVRSNLQPGTPASHSAMRALPYLEAVINETLRYHPAVSMPMERIVPQGGLALSDGSVVPAGSVVGMNPYIVGRNKVMFGSDADEFRPERWLQQNDESDAAFKERLQRWGSGNINFGGGSRICLGRNLSMMEVYKVVPTLIATFDFELSDPNEQWWTCSRWFFRAKGVTCNIRARSGE
ncbi:hypothetical protein G7Z17_g1011 [Cylindrodendrum hubeiense]|uniref:Pisatin demethylase n=1 Tax=Cylindrodendrum hubeiense TaxID=595255 RepID=A0A9P5HJ53_9HYPO|nr:hypothetical protein G7Z17_g1011 [Cylindrodendrum hubeiense]